MKHQINTLLIGSLIILTGQAQAGLVRDGVWEIQEGDNLKSILKSALPEQPLRQKRLKRLSPLLNKSSFDDKGKLIVGQNLRLPGVKMPSNEVMADSEQIGKVLITNGPTTARAADGKQRVLNRGSAINKGDTIKTKGARAQVRFTDGSLVALRPNTEFKVEEYSYSGQQDGSERGIYNLLKGGFRTISGAIGKVNKSNYRVKTPVATIGIRGTHYGVTLCSAGSCADQGLADGLYGGVVDGSIKTTNDGGSSIFNNDEYFLISDLGSLAQALLAPPGVIFDDPAQPPAPTEEKSQEKKKSTKEKRIEEAVAAAVEEKKADFDGTLDGEQIRDLVELVRKELGEDVVIDDNTLTELLGLAETETGATLTHPALPGTPAEAGTVAGFSFSGPDPFTGNAVAVAEGIAQNAGTMRVNTGASNGIDTVFLGASFETTDDGVDLIRAIDTTGATLADAGVNNGFHANYDSNLGLGWGRWDNATVRATAVIGNAVITKEVKPDSGIHYVISDPSKTLDSISKLDNAISTIGLNNIQISTEAFFTLKGQTIPKDFAGNIASSHSTSLGIDFVNQQLTYFEATATINGANYTINNNNNNISLVSLLGVADSGEVLSGQCTGGVCGATLDLKGNLNLILTNTGFSSIGAGVNYSGQTANNGDPQVGFSGAATFETINQGGT